MNEREVLISQYRAALAMLKQTIVACPEADWSSPNHQAPLWQIAYHALFFTHLYLQDSEQSFAPWSKHRPEYGGDGEVPLAAEEAPDKALLLEYLDFCEQEVVERVPGLNLAGESGFDWLRFTKLELQIYSIRHIQQHVGELMERLGGRGGIVFDWVGARRSA